MTDSQSYIQIDDKQIYSKPATKTGRQRDDHTDRQAYKQTDIQTVTETDRLRDKLALYLL